mmetsp:Transcript_39731/g.99472  ORF Transcript_39731/g.99472 Transcript_39731/m.99472 type:complete len:218 (+) Transcript_39731:229-882(+)
MRPNPCHLEHRPLVRPLDRPRDPVRPLLQVLDRPCGLDRPFDLDRPRDLVGPLPAILGVNHEGRKLGGAHLVAGLEAHEELDRGSPPGEGALHKVGPQVIPRLGDEPSGGVRVAGEARDELLAHHRVWLHLDRHHALPLHSKLSIDAAASSTGLPVVLDQCLLVLHTPRSRRKDDVLLLGLCQLLTALSLGELRKVVRSAHLPVVCSRKLLHLIPLR